MALADLMKKGFITSATATTATQATDTVKTAPIVATVAAVAVASIKDRGGNTQTVATVAKVAVAKEIIQNQESDWRAALVDEFMEVDGMTRTEADAMAAISVQPRTPAVWVAMVAELDRLIEAYCTSAQVSTEAKARIRAASHSQSLASIPHAVDWFRAELQALQNTISTKAQND